METGEIQKTKNRINGLFENGGKGIISVYFTAGFPSKTDTLRIAKALDQSGADLIEVGIPFSDPVADGPTIQESNTQALKNGMSLTLLFDQLKELRKEVSIPVIFMGYINPVMQFGMERFCQKCAEIGVDGLIFPDLPMAEYLEEYKELFESYGLKNIFLITPQTSEERIRLIDANTDGFIYMVSTASTTGARDSFGEEHLTYFDRIKNMVLKNPLLVGFGISNHKTYTLVNSYASGVIIGSAFIRLLSKSTQLEEDINQFIKDIKN